MNYTAKKSSVLLASVAIFVVTGLGACTQNETSADTQPVEIQVSPQTELTSENEAVLQDMAAVAIAVSDIQSAEAFYTDVLGMKTVRALSTDDYDEVIMATGNEKGTKLVLFQSHKTVEPVSARVVFYTQNAETILQKFKDKNLEIVRELSPVAERVPIKIGIAKDADGNTLEFIERG